ERGEVVPVGLDFRSVGDVEADRAEDRLDAPPGAADRMHAATAAAAARQRDVERLPAKTGFEFLQRQIFPAGIERSFDSLNRGVVVLPRRFSFFSGQFSQ